MFSIEFQSCLTTMEITLAFATCQACHLWLIILQSCIRDCQAPICVCG